jgi:hypothetical protein
MHSRETGCPQGRTPTHITPPPQVTALVHVLSPTHVPSPACVPSPAHVPFPTHVPSPTCIVPSPAWLICALSLNTCTQDVQSLSSLPPPSVPTSLLTFSGSPYNFTLLSPLHVFNLLIPTTITNVT